MLKYINHYRDALDPAPALGPRLASKVRLVILDEEYGYADAAKPGPVPPFPCNQYYDLKTFRWWMQTGRAAYGKALMWNIG